MDCEAGVDEACNGEGGDSAFVWFISSEVVRFDKVRNGEADGESNDKLLPLLLRTGVDAEDDDCLLLIRGDLPTEFDLSPTI